MLKVTHTLSILAVCSFITSTQASRTEKEQGAEQNPRPGTALIVKGGPAESFSPAVQKILRENADYIAPTASLKTLDNYFNTDCSTVFGAAGEILDLFSNGKKKDITTVEEALTALPKDHVLAVHKFQTTVSEQGEPAIVTQSAQLAGGAPVQYVGTLKFQKNEDNGRLLNIQIQFDLKGQTPPIFSCEETPSNKESDFSRELTKLKKGVMHVAIYAPEDNAIETDTGDIFAVGQKFRLD